MCFFNLGPRALEMLQAPRYLNPALYKSFDVKEWGPKRRHKAKEVWGGHRWIQGIFWGGLRDKFIRMCINCIAVKTQLLTQLFFNQHC